MFAAATSLSVAYNAGLTADPGGVPGIEIFYIYTAFNALINNRADFGLANSTDVCVMPEQSPVACRQADEQVFWKGMHPANVAHGILADVVANALAD